MSGRALNKYMIICDGCGAERGTQGEYSNAIEARGALYGDGWRFPSKRKRNNADSITVSDVCPTCLPGWKPEAALDTWKNRRAGGGE